MWSVNDIITATGGRLISGSQETEFSGISTDTRSLKPGDLFIALKGEHHDAHAFVAEAFSKGAQGALVMHPSIDYHGTVIVVSNTLTALGDLAQYLRNSFNLPVVGITGSTGKTTVKEFVASILSREGKCLKTEKNFNNLVGVPITLLGLKKEHDFAVIEMGTNRPGEIERLSSIARPNISVITNISPAHLNGLKSIEGIIKEKQAIFRNTIPGGIAILNPYMDYMDGIEIPKGLDRITFSLSEDTDVRAKNIISSNMKGSDFVADIAGKDVRIKVGIPGMHNILNALAASACAVALGMDTETIAYGIENAGFPGSRVEVTVSDALTIIDDSYNANPASMKAALDILKGFPHTFKIAVLGDMLELGSDSSYWHEQLGRWTASSGVDRLIVTGKFASLVADSAISEGMDASSVFKVSGINEVKGLMSDIIGKTGKDAVVLVKASRAVQLDRIVGYLKAVA
ncbi:MAG: UDP-N-acetylmuramoyl-tripeptide--D-alanyl-D-alanine ligase [Deltaproteobacteria bacterium]|nr:UDP-N-acetylmuramoyl-tripeptide--D-alanyl-D-alanine ligase [Deltaproteobacteria bacterium]